MLVGNFGECYIGLGLGFVVGSVEKVFYEVCRCGGEMSVYGRFRGVYGLVFLSVMLLFLVEECCM